MGKKIKESPDAIRNNSGSPYITFSEGKNYSFGYYKRKFYLGDEGQIHGSMFTHDGYKLTRFRMSYPGRIWVAPKKIVSFWKYPKDITRMRNIISDLEKAFKTKFSVHLDIWNKFKLDILVKPNSKEYAGNFDWEKIDHRVGYGKQSKFNDSIGTKGCTSQLISFSDYKSSIDYKGSADDVEHIKSPTKKKQKDVFGSFGSKKNQAGLTATQLHQLIRTSDGVIKLKSLIENMSQRKKINESPDFIDFADSDVELFHDDDDAICFGSYDNRMYLSSPGATHIDIIDTYDLPINEPRIGLTYAGRFWQSEKIITFWEYPRTAAEMKETIFDIQIAYRNHFTKDIDIWNKYNIEVLVSDKNTQKFTDWEYFNSDGSNEFVPDGYHTDIIPVKSFKKSLQRKKKDLQIKHTLSPIAKGDSDIPSGAGSKKLPVGLTTTQRHQMQMTSDSTIKLKKLVEYTIGKVSKQINVKIDIDKTVHAGQQQFRHGDKPITDMEITEVVNLALPKIANMLIFDEIDMGDYVLIKHRGTMLNIVGALHPGSNEEIDFVVVTVMRKENFMPKQGTKVIEV